MRWPTSAAWYTLAPVGATAADALGWAAIAAGIGCATSYPGSPSALTLRSLFSQRRQLRPATVPHLEWSTNERVALEVAVGFCLAGRRALVCTKSVGMNVMVDTLMTVNLTPLPAGLVILLGDDPGAYGSQNDQDSRTLADLLELPMLEPRDACQGMELMGAAFTASEESGLPVVLRITRSYEQLPAPAELIPPDRWNVRVGVAERERLRYFPYPGNAVDKHRDLHRRLAVASNWSDDSSLNPTLEDPASEPLGAIAVGVCATKLANLAPKGMCILQLATLFPTAEEVIAAFLVRHRHVLVLEETEPFVEQRAAAVAQRAGIATRICGKLTGHVAAVGELYRWQICDALRYFAEDAGDPGRVSIGASFTAAGEAAEQPQRRSYCQDCPLDEVMDAVERTVAARSPRPWLVADPGCLAGQAERLDAKFALGSAVAVAAGMACAGHPAVALFGDSSFFHTALPAICNAVTQGSRVTLVVLDNHGAVTTGGQPHPSLAIGRMAAACGASAVREVDVNGLASELESALDGEGVQVIIVDLPCEHSASYIDGM